MGEVIRETGRRGRRWISTNQLGNSRISLRRVVKKRAEAAKTTEAERRAPGLGDK